MVELKRILEAFGSTPDDLLRVVRLERLLGDAFDPYTFMSAFGVLVESVGIIGRRCEGSIGKPSNGMRWSLCPRMLLRRR